VTYFDAGPMTPVEVNAVVGAEVLDILTDGPDAYRWRPATGDDRSHDITEGGMIAHDE
jgi:hypothetical protein